MLVHTSMQQKYEQLMSFAMNHPLKLTVRKKIAKELSEETTEIRRPRLLSRYEIIQSSYIACLFSIKNFSVIHCLKNYLNVFCFIQQRSLHIKFKQFLADLSVSRTSLNTFTSYPEYVFCDEKSELLKLWNDKKLKFSYDLVYLGKIYQICCCFL